MIQDLMRRVSMMLAPGRVVGGVDANGTLGLTVQIGPYERRENVPQMGLHGIVSSPLDGADLVVAFRGGNRAEPVVIGVNDQAHRMRNVERGAVGLAHHQGRSILFDSTGCTINGGGMPVTIKNASIVRIEGDLQVTGEIKAMCDGPSVTLSQHKHAGGPPPDPYT